MASRLRLPTDSPWLVRDTVNDTQPLQVGDLVLVKGQTNALLTVTAVGATFINSRTTPTTRFTSTRPATRQTGRWEPSAG